MILTALGIPQGGNALGIVEGLSQMQLQLRKGSGSVQGGMGDGGQHRHIVIALMGLTVVRHHAGTVDGQHHVVIHQGGIVDQLIVRSLQEGGIHRKHR